MPGISKSIAQSRLTLIDEPGRSGPNLTFAEVCNLNAAEIGDRFALIDRRNRYTWSEVKLISDRLAQALLERDIMRPDIVMVHLPNSAEQFLIRLACEKSGVRIVLTNSAFRETELFSIIERTKPRVAFVSKASAVRGHYDQ